jgi:DNA-nicking Smr family endonuclease
MFTSHHSLEDHAVTDNDDDNDEFRRAFSDARPLRVEERVPETKPKPKPRARFSKADERQALQESLRDDIDTIEDGEPCGSSRAVVSACEQRSICTG